MPQIKRDGVAHQVAAESLPAPVDQDAETRPMAPLPPWQFKAVVDFLEVDTAIRTAMSSQADAWDRVWLLNYYEGATLYTFDSVPLQTIIDLAELDRDAFAAAWSKMAAA